MAEYIDKGKAISIAEKFGCNNGSCIGKHSGVADVIASLISDLPATDVAPVRHGRWVQVMRWSTKAKYRCSVCGRAIMSATKLNIEEYPYCHCGAKMDLEK